MFENKPDQNKTQNIFLSIESGEKIKKSQLKEIIHDEIINHRRSCIEGGKILCLKYKINLNDYIPQQLATKKNTGSEKLN